MKLLSSVVAAACLLSTSAAFADIGGFMSEGGCYDGRGTISGLVCQTRTQDFNQLGFYGQVKAELSYDNSGSVLVNLSLDLNDPQNVFYAEANLPIIVRAFRWTNYGQSKSYVTTTPDSRAMILPRIYGERRLIGGNAAFTLKMNLGAESVEQIDRLEILLPGVQGIINVDL